MEQWIDSLLVYCLTQRCSYTFFIRFILKIDTSVISTQCCSHCSSGLDLGSCALNSKSLNINVAVHSPTELYWNDLLMFNSANKSDLMLYNFIFKAWGWYIIYVSLHMTANLKVKHTFLGVFKFFFCLSVSLEQAFVYFWSLMDHLNAA